MKSHFILRGSILLGLLFCLPNCAADKKDLPNTPEKVARQWQQWVDSNQYQAARELSTSNAIEWLDWVEETLEKNGVEEEVMEPAKFLSMHCTQKGNEATCAYIIDDEGLQYRDSFHLQRIKGQWLVDIPEQDLIEDDTLEELFKENEPNQ